MLIPLKADPRQDQQYRAADGATVLTRVYPVPAANAVALIDANFPLGGLMEGEADTVLAARVQRVNVRKIKGEERSEIVVTYVRRQAR